MSDTKIQITTLTPEELLGIVGNLDDMAFGLEQKLNENIEAHCNLVESLSAIQEAMKIVSALYREKVGDRIVPIS